MLDSVDASSSMRGPGLLLACKFGSEDAAVREVQRALRELHGKPQLQKATSAASLDSDKSDDTAAKGEGRHRSIEDTRETRRRRAQRPRVAPIRRIWRPRRRRPNRRTNARGTTPG